MVPRLVVHENPDGRATPLLLLGALREIDPTVELVYFGARDWRLGAVRPTAMRARKGEEILQREDRRAPRERNTKNVLLGFLLRQGFAQIAKYIEPAGGDISSVVQTESGEHVTVLNHFTRIDADYRRDQGESDVMAAVKELRDGPETEAQKKFNDYTATEGRAHYAREVRGRVTFGYGGQTGKGARVLTPPKPKIITGDEVLADLAEIMAELGSESGSLL